MGPVPIMGGNRKYPMKRSRNNKHPITNKLKDSSSRLTKDTYPSNNSGKNPVPRSPLPESHLKGTRLEGLSAKFELLSMREEGDLTCN